MRLERLNNLPLNTVTSNFVAIFLFFGTASSFIERISLSIIEAEREAILFLFGCSEVNSTWIITSGLANQRAPKALFTCVAYTNKNYSSVLFRLFNYFSFKINQITKIQKKKKKKRKDFILYPFNNLCVFNMYQMRELAF